MEKLRVRQLSPQYRKPFRSQLQAGLPREPGEQRHPPAHGKVLQPEDLNTDRTQAEADKRVRTPIKLQRHETPQRLERPNQEAYAEWLARSPCGGDKKVAEPIGRHEWKNHYCQQQPRGRPGC